MASLPPIDPAAVDTAVASSDAAPIDSDPATYSSSDTSSSPSEEDEKKDEKKDEGKKAPDEKKAEKKKPQIDDQKAESMASAAMSIAGKMEILAEDHENPLTALFSKGKDSPGAPDGQMDYETSQSASDLSSSEDPTSEAIDDEDLTAGQGMTLGG